MSILYKIKKTIKNNLVCNFSIKQMRFEQRRYELLNHILHDMELGVSRERYFDHEIVVSLTTWGKRLYDVAFAIESIMQQSMKANKIVLWLEEDLKGKVLPYALQNQQKRGLEIYYCKDLLAYKKLIPSMRKYPNDAIITVDDDLLFDFDLVERLIMAYREQPATIHCCRKHIMLFNKGRLLPYIKWMRCNSEVGVNKMNFFTGGGGVLYPPHCLDEEVFNEVVFMDICKYADDVWFNAMALKKGTPINKIYTRDPQGEDYLENKGVQDDALKRINLYGDHLNDRQIESVFSRYGLYDKLR